MARKSRNHQFDLPALELRCMKALWNAGSATVHEIRAKLMPQRPLAYTTVMTIMDRLARKGIVEREKNGRAHLYHAVVPREVISERALTQLVENFFGGSREELRKHLEVQERPLLEVAPAEHNAIRSSNGSTPPAHGKDKVEAGIDASLL